MKKSIVYSVGVKHGDRNTGKVGGELTYGEVIVSWPSALTDQPSRIRFAQVEITNRNGERVIIDAAVLPELATAILMAKEKVYAG